MIMTLAQAIEKLQDELESSKYNLETLISISYFTEERIKSIGKQILLIKIKFILKISNIKRLYLLLIL